MEEKRRNARNGKNPEKIGRNMEKQKEIRRNQKKTRRNQKKIEDPLETHRKVQK